MFHAPTAINLPLVPQVSQKRRTEVAAVPSDRDTRPVRTSFCESQPPTRDLEQLDRNRRSSYLPADCIPVPRLSDQAMFPEDLVNI